METIPEMEIFLIELKKIKERINYIMEFENFGNFVNYLRNKIITQPGEDCEGDDLRIDFYDDELTFTVNDLYDGPQIFYNTTGKIDVIFRKVDHELMDDDANVNIEQVKVAAAIIKLIEANKEMLNKFLSREE